MNACPVLHVSFNDPEHEFPVVLPMLGCTGDFEVRSMKGGNSGELGEGDVRVRC